MTLLILAIVVACLAYANGANDNFKGVATLIGSHTTTFRRAITWASACTFAGSLASVLLAGELLKNFSGKGLIDESLVVQPNFAAAVSLGAGLTVLVATRFGLPVSTTHGLLGALLGAGVTAGSGIALPKLFGTFLVPLLFSPVLAILATMVVYPLLRLTRKRLGVTSETCLCVGNQVVETIAAGGAAQMAYRTEQLTLIHGETVHCKEAYSGTVMGVNAEQSLNVLHFLSSGVVSFARGLNDTPKIAALLLVAPGFSGQASLCTVAVAMIIGGLISGKKVAETMSHKITRMNHGQGFTANALTGLIVIGASRLGLPVSTTHVSCGALFGIGAVNRTANRQVILSILGAWLITLPMAAAFSTITWFVIRQLV